MGEKAPAVPAPATSATIDATDTFIAVQYEGRSDYVLLEAPCSLKARWNDMPPTQRRLTQRSDGLTMTLDSFDRSITWIDLFDRRPSAVGLHAIMHAMLHALCVRTYLSVVRLIQRCIAASTHCILWQRCLYRCVSRTATFTLLQDTFAQSRRLQKVTDVY